ncbi:MAG: thioredoxin-disulfide reductase [Armatimonadota bacterium]
MSIGNDVRKVTILGTGPAGLTAAIYAARADLQPLIISGTNPGGQLMITTEVENFPGFRDGIMGPQLMDEMQQQAERFGTEIRSGLVTAVDFSKKPFSLVVDGEDEIRTHAVIIATGASAKLLNIESEAKLMGHGVSACATCDGFFFRDKEILVVGGGDTAMEEATFLSKFASRVTIVHRRDELRASKIMQQRAKDNPKIDYIWDSVIVDIHDVTKGHVTGVTLKNLRTGPESFVETQGVFMAIGHQPNTKVFEGLLDMNSVGYLCVDGVKTSIEGVFAAGDVADFTYRQAITAAGTGCAAAIEAERWLASQGIH